MRMKNVTAMDDRMIIKMMFNASIQTLDSFRELLIRIGDEVMTQHEILEEIDKYKAALKVVYEDDKPE